jgi:hypothetical protein
VVDVDLERFFDREQHDALMARVARRLADKRVLDGLVEFIGRRLKLKVNKDKSSVKHAVKATILGFGFHFRREGTVGIRVARKSLERMRWRIRSLTGCSWRISMPERIELLNRYIGGWSAYFAMAETPSVFGDSDSWLRRRLRQVRWKEWKRPKTRRKNPLALGVTPREAREWAGSSEGCWRMAGSPTLTCALPNARWQQLGLLGFSHGWRRRSWST